jgi:type II secretory ATPase GspE/PulE/Tfp pilus assembly ATPase PilB-like protein
MELDIDTAVAAGASDIHYEPVSSGGRMRVRIDGSLAEVRSFPQAEHQKLISKLKILANLDIAEKRRPQDGRFSVTVGNRQIDIRLSVLPTVSGEKAVLRLLYEQHTSPTFSTLGLSGDNQELLERIMRYPVGMLIFTGPTGSGKTTLLYTLLKQLVHDSVNITTIEDPVEYALPGVNQVQIKAEIGFTFAAALRAILRQDPNVIMVGEIRDSETAEIAIRAALTGHLVLTTLHTNDAVSAIARLMEMGIEPYLIASAVRLVAGQRLVRTIHSECRGSGCSGCRNTGFSGRTGVYEIMEIDHLLEALIAGKASKGLLNEHLAKKQFKHMWKHGLELVAQGRTTMAELQREVPFNAV